MDTQTSGLDSLLNSRAVPAIFSWTRLPAPCLTSVALALPLRLVYASKSINVWLGNRWSGYGYKAAAAACAACQRHIKQREAGELAGASGHPGIQPGQGRRGCHSAPGRRCLASAARCASRNSGSRFRGLAYVIFHIRLWASILVNWCMLPRILSLPDCKRRQSCMPGNLYLRQCAFPPLAFAIIREAECR